MKLRSILLGTIVATMTLGCSDDSDDGESERTVVQQQCDSLMSLWCNHTIDCLVEGGQVTAAEGAEGKGQCTAALEGLCNAAIDVRPEYDACLDAINAMSCETIITGYETDTLELPTICMGVVIVG